MNARAAVMVFAGMQTLGGADLPGAMAKFQAGDCNGVIAILSKARTPDPQAGDVPYVMLAACYLQLGRVTEGMTVVRDGLAALPQSGLLKRMLAQHLFQEDPLRQEVGTLLEGAMTALPGDPESRHYFAQWAYMNNRDQDCVQREREALQAPQLSAMARLQMNTLIGMCEGRSGDPDAARAAFEIAWQINKSLPQFDASAAHRYALFLSSYEAADQLKVVLGEILARAPRHGPTLLEQAKLLEREGKTQDAIEAANLVLGADGNDAGSIREAHIVLARSYFRLGQRQQAEEQQKWVDEHPPAPARKPSDL